MENSAGGKRKGQAALKNQEKGSTGCPFPMGLQFSDRVITGSSRTGGVTGFPSPDAVGIIAGRATDRVVLVKVLHRHRLVIKR